MSSCKKGELIINPSTQRPIRVGSRTWINLVKKGVLEGTFSDNNIIEEKYVEVPEAQFEEKIKQLNEKLPVGTQAVRGRGKYANKIVKRNKPLSVEELTKSTAKKASKVVVNNIENLNEDDYNDIEKRLEQLIMDEMSGIKNNSAPPCCGSKKKLNLKVIKNVIDSDVEEFSDETFDDKSD